MYLYENCDYWQNNGHTARCSHKFSYKMLNVGYKIVVPYLNHITFIMLFIFSGLRPPALKILIWYLIYYVVFSRLSYRQDKENG